MYVFGELPSDLTEIDETLGPPPAWYRSGAGIYSPQVVYPHFYGLGDREEEIEVNPVEQLRALKFKQEMNKRIPVEANRYTEIDPISPMFRDKKAKFGFGDTDTKTSVVAIAIIVLVLFLIFNRK